MDSTVRCNASSEHMSAAVVVTPVYVLCALRWPRRSVLHHVDRQVWIRAYHILKLFALLTGLGGEVELTLKVNEGDDTVTNLWSRGGGVVRDNACLEDLVGRLGVVNDRIELLDRERLETRDVVLLSGTSVLIAFLDFVYRALPCPQSRTCTRGSSSCRRGTPLCRRCSRRCRGT